MIKGILGAEEPDPGNTVRILFTGSANNAVENCLCPDKPLGAVEKRAAFMTEYRRRYPDALFFDSGDNFFDDGHEEEKAIIVKAFEIIEYNLINPGDQDIVYAPFDYFDLPALVQVHQTAEKFYIRGESLSVFNILHPECTVFYPEFLFEDAVTEENASAIKAWLEEEGEQSYCILLSHSGMDRDREWAQQFPDIDLIIGGHSQTVTDSLLMVEGVPIVQAGGDGAYVGEVLLDPGRKELLSLEMHAMELAMPNHPEIESMLKDMKARRWQKSRDFDPEFMVDDNIAVAKSGRCGECHNLEYEKWRKGPHANAFRTLVDEHKDKQDRCARCHVTGWQRNPGYWDQNISPEYRNVGCTECHYTASDHFGSPKKYPPADISVSHCRRCHQGEYGRGFDYDKALEKIKCGAGK